MKLPDNPTTEELIIHIVDRARRLLDFDRTYATGERTSFSMGRFDLTADLETAPGGVDGSCVALSVWEMCSQPLCVFINHETGAIERTLTFDYDKCMEVVPYLARNLVLDDLSDL